MLILENPALRGESRVTNTLFAGIQMIMPGEIAPAHRHVSSAIRFVLDGEGAYTAVEGEKAFMSPGDFVITANWAPHDHGNPSDKPMMWLDVLDVPTINFYETSFGEDFGSRRRTTRRDGDSLELLRLRRAARRHRGKQAHADHQLYLRAHASDHRADDWRPATSTKATARGSATPIRAPAARCCRPWAPIWRCCRKASAVSLTVRPTAPSSSARRGAGTTTVDGQVLEWGPRDVFVVPSWKRYAHTAAEQSVLFSISDRPAQEALGIWREER